MFEELGFTLQLEVKGLASLARLIARNQRCGIYILHFANGEYYVGQAVDVTRRYLEHQKNHDDIACVSFRPTPREKLNEIEQWIIATLEGRGLLLRNIALANLVIGERNFDLVMTPEQQQRWRDDITYVDHNGPRSDDLNLRRKYQRRFELFLGVPYVESVIHALAVYVRATLPAYRRSECSFWSVTCQPAGKDGDLIARINLYWQEVCSVYLDKDPTFVFQVAGSSLKAQGLWRYWQMRWRHRLWAMLNYVHPSGGQDQIRVECPANRVERLLADPLFLSSARELNLRLMRKGSTAFARYHCFPLADRLIE